jgi:hypothetical protein
MIWLIAHLLPRVPMQSLSPRPGDKQKTEKERLFADGKGGRGWARSRIILSDLKKAKLSKNYSILSAYCKRQIP